MPDCESTEIHACGRRGQGFDEGKRAPYDSRGTTVLNERLHELRETGVVDLGEGDGYGLTPLGHQLRHALRPLSEWSERWAREYRAR